MKKGITVAEIAVFAIAVFILTLLFTPIVSKKIPEKTTEISCNKDCGPDCIDCDRCEGMCKECRKNYELINGLCVLVTTRNEDIYYPAEENYYPQTNEEEQYKENSCHYSCGNNCLVCDTCEGKCKQCDSDFDLEDGICVCNKQCGYNQRLDKASCECVDVCNYSCEANCAKCNTCTGVCEGCAKGYILFDGYCIADKTETPISNECTKTCPEDYKLDKDNCRCVACNTPCKANCLTCDKCTGNCTQCRSGCKKAEDGSCKFIEKEKIETPAPSKPKTEFVSDVARQCRKICKTGYKLNRDLCECVACTNNCTSNCNDCDRCTGVCKKCDTGYDLKDNKCVKKAMVYTYKYIRHVCTNTCKAPHVISPSCACYCPNDCPKGFIQVYQTCKCEADIKTKATVNVNGINQVCPNGQWKEISRNSTGTKVTFKCSSTGSTFVKSF